MFIKKPEYKGFFSSEAYHLLLFYLHSMQTLNLSMSLSHVCFPLLNQYTEITFN